MQPAPDLSDSLQSNAAQNYDRLFVRANARLARRFPLQPTLHDCAKFTHDIAQITLIVGKLRHLLKADDLLDPYLCLGGFYLGQGDFDEAENWYTTGIAHLEDQLTTHHASTARLMNALAILFRTKGNYGEAERLWLKLVDIKRQTPGDTNTDIITLLNNVIPLYLEMKRLSDAEALIDESLELFKQLDDEQALTVELPVYNNLATYFHERGDLESAKEYYEITYNIIKDTLGEKHPRMVRKSANIGVFFHEKGDYGRAMTAYNSALALALEIFGERHLETASVISRMAPIFSEFGNPIETEEYYLKALEILGDLFEGNHPLFAETLWDLGVLYDNQGIYDHAEKAYNEAFEQSKALLGDSHPKVIFAMSELAIFYQKLGEGDLALSLAMEAEQVLKSTHGKTELYAKVLQNLATVCQRLGHVDFAMRFFDEALELYKYYCGEEHLKVARCLWAVGQTYDEHGANKEAEPVYLESLSVASKVLGETHPELGKMEVNLGEFYLKIGRASEAKLYFERALSIFLAELGDDNYRVLECRQALEQIS